MSWHIIRAIVSLYMQFFVTSAQKQISGLPFVQGLLSSVTVRYLRLFENQIRKNVNVSEDSAGITVPQTRSFAQ